MTLEEWRAEGQRRFGPDFQAWKFRCPICDHVASVADFRQYADRGATPNSATCECIGRYSMGKPALGERRQSVTKGNGPCDYAGYGLFRLSPVHVLQPEGKGPTHCFAFADEPVAAAVAS